MLTITPCDAMTDSDRVKRLRSLRTVFTLIVMAMALTVLSGWAIGNRSMTSVLPGLITMKVNTAIELMLLAVAMHLCEHCSRLGRMLFVAIISVSLFIALGTLAEYLFRIDLRIDNALFVDRDSVQFPGRNSPLTNVCVIGIAVGYILLCINRAIASAQLLLLIVSSAPLMTLGGYLYRAPAMYTAAPWPVVALNTSVALMLLCLGGLMASSGTGLMSIITSNSMAGTLSRRLLPAAAGLPLITGLVVLIGEYEQLYSTAFGSAMLIACCAIFFALAVCLTVTHLWNTEVINRGALLESARLLEAERQARTRAEEADRLKNEFLSVVSHELRTPLTAILGWAQLLQRKANDEELDEALSIIVDNAKAQKQIIGDLLDMGRVSSGKLLLQLEPVALQTAIESAVDSVRPTAFSKNIRIDIDSSLVGERVHGDPNRLQQVFWNLLSNAVKFTPRSGFIRVRAAAENGNLLVSVIDNGGGIAPEFLPHVFDRFRQADASTSRLHGGLGLGLSIVKQLIELHGGTVSVRSGGVGKGATFGVSLPQLMVSEQADENRCAPAPAIDLQGYRILVVDDEPDMRSLVKRELEEARATAEAAGSGEEAIELLRAKPFDVMISDIGMPNEDGYSLIRRVRALGPAGQLPAIALTAYVRDEDRAAALEASFARHLAKPFDPKTLISLVAEVIAERKQPSRRVS